MPEDNKKPGRPRTLNTNESPYGGYMARWGRGYQEFMRGRVSWHQPFVKRMESFSTSHMFSTEIALATGRELVMISRMDGNTFIMEIVPYMNKINSSAARTVIAAGSLREKVTGNFI